MGNVGLNCRTNIIARYKKARLFASTLAATAACLAGGCLFIVASAISADETISNGLGEGAVPPRTIDDIVARLRVESSRETDQRRDLIRVADMQPPTGDGLAVARFYARRADAAEQLGRVRQAIDDWKRAKEAGDSASRGLPFEKVGWSFGYGSVLIVGGDFGLGLAAMQQAIADVRRGTSYNERSPSQAVRAGHAFGRTATFEALLAAMLVDVGDLDAARKAISRSRLYRRGLETLVSLAWSNNVTLNEETVSGVAISRAMQDGAEARLVAMEGGFAEATERYRKAYRDALKAETGLTGISKSKIAAVRHEVRVGLAEAYMLLGRLADAEAEARAALNDALDGFGVTSLQTARSLHVINELFFLEGRYNDVETLAQLVLVNLENAGALAGSIHVLRARIQLGRAFAGRHDWSRAAEMYLEIEAAVAGGGLGHILDPEPARSLAYLENDQPAFALRAIEAEIALLTASRDDGDPTLIEAKAFRAAVLARLDRTDEARTLIDEAVRDLVDNEARLRPASPISEQRLRVIVDAYSDLHAGPDANGLSQDRDAILFRISEAIRGSTVAQALLASAERVAVGTTSLAALVRDRQDTRNERIAVLGRLTLALGLPTAERNKDLIVELRERADSLQKKTGAINREIGDKFPDYSSLGNPRLHDLDEFVAALRPGEAAVVFLVNADRIHAWAVRSDGSRRYRAVPVGRDEMVALIDTLRESLDPGPLARIGDIPPFASDAAYRVFAALLGPFEDVWGSAKTLLIVTDSPLSRLPFALLLTSPWQPDVAEPLRFAGYRGAPWLARKLALTRLPTAGSLVTIRRTPRKSAEYAFLGFGDPIFDPDSVETQPGASRGGGQADILRNLPRLRGLSTARLRDLPRLPETAEEVSVIASLLGAVADRDVYLRERASENTVFELNDRGELAKYRVVSFATHGLVPRDLDGLFRPALAMSHPSFGGGRGDGLMVLDEILNLKLNADWVILSACNTGAGEGAGAEAVSGLGRAFFFAGARALLVSNWPVHSDATKELMINVFRSPHAESRRAEALNAAMLDLVDNDGYTDPGGKMLFSYAHPIFWAPFNLYGDPGQP